MSTLLCSTVILILILCAAISSSSPYTLVQTGGADPYRFVKTKRPIKASVPASLVAPTALLPSSQSFQSILGWLGGFYLDPQNETITATQTTPAKGVETSNEEQELSSVAAVATSGGLTVSNSSSAAIVDAENRFLRPSFSAQQQFSKNNVRDYAFNSFLEFNDLIEWYDMRMQDTNADSEAGVRVERQTLATTEEGRPVVLYKITSANNGRNGVRLARPVLWMDCLIHAREWISGSTCSYLYNRLLRDSRTDAALRTMLQKVDIWMAPVLNPDGYAYTHSTSRFWRKNRQRNPQRPGCPGIDLNRNWPAFYTQSNLVAPLSSSDSCDDLYAGPTYLSARETKGVFDFLASNRNLIKVALTFHSFGQLWLIPYGYSDKPGSRGPKFPRYDSTYALFRPVVDTVQRTRRVNHLNRCNKPLSNGRNPCEYEFGNTVDVIQYAGGGGSDDTMAAMGICHVATVELPPAGSEAGSARRNGFDISPQEIVQVGDEIWQGMRVLLKTMSDTMSTSYCLSSVGQLPKFKAVDDTGSNGSVTPWTAESLLPLADGENGGSSGVSGSAELENTEKVPSVFRRPFEQGILNSRG